MVFMISFAVSDVKNAMIDKSAPASSYLREHGDLTGGHVSKHSSNFVDLTGQKFGRLTVLELSHKQNGHIFWLCRCDCGELKTAMGGNLKRGHVKSCGCFLRQVSSARLKTHGMSRTSEYSIWDGMKARCQNVQNTAYPNYGGRGITVCERWQTFENFYADMGSRPSEKHSVDRRDNDRGYEPDNCYWATPTEQLNNTRVNIAVEYEGVAYPSMVLLCRALGIDDADFRQYYRRRGLSVEESVKLSRPSEREPVPNPKNRPYTFNGESHTLKEWATITGIPYSTLTKRLTYGWTIERTLTTPRKNHPLHVSNGQLS